MFITHEEPFQHPVQQAFLWHMPLAPFALHVLPSAQTGALLWHVFPAVLILHS